MTDFCVGPSGPSLTYCEHGFQYSHALDRVAVVYVPIEPQRTLPKRVKKRRVKFDDKLGKPQGKLLCLKCGQWNQSEDHECPRGI